jgi:hypothetical protein
MVLYRHIPDKAALLDGVAEVVLAQLVRRDGGWRIASYHNSPAS